MTLRWVPWFGATAAASTSNPITTAQRIPVSAERYFVWMNCVLKVLVYVRKRNLFGGYEDFLRIEDPKAKTQ